MADKISKGTLKPALTHDKRLNPQSLRLVLSGIIDIEFDGNLKKAASELNKALPSLKNRTLRTNFTSNVLYNIIHDTTHIKYSHLEAFALYLRVPVGLILLFSRMSANEAEGHPEWNRNLLSGVQRVMESYSERLAGKDRDLPLRTQEFLDMLKLYRDEQDAVQLSLPVDVPRRSRRKTEQGTA